LTSAGRFLRRFKLDELPQLINVVRGEMSFVGPRPQVEWAVKLYNSEEQALLSVRPGITDFASLRFRNEGEILRGSIDPDRDYMEKIAPHKIRLGLYYVRHYSFTVDIKIIAATLLSLGGVDPSWCLPPAPANA
jgi:lipopolysaccharide/colanic/teichoic acid biosynthesis glycosyltransferase